MDKIIGEPHTNAVIDNNAFMFTSEGDIKTVMDYLAAHVGQMNVEFNFIDANTNVRYTIRKDHI